jgi:hypothetical protein
MVWPFRLKRSRARAKLRGRSARKTKSIEGTSVVSTPIDVPGGVVPAASYACHYCNRSNGTKTRDHKLPRMLGGAGLPGNVVRCCLMCNIIKGARPYDLFVVFFRDFLEVHGQEYRTSDPDDGEAIRMMSRKFNAWLHGLQHAEGEVAKFEGV